MNSSNGTTLQFRDRQGTTQRMTIRAVPPRVVQLLERLVNAVPDAAWLTMDVYDSEPGYRWKHGVASLTIRLDADHSAASADHQ